MAAKPLDVVINEIAWMGTNNSVNDEWLELYNNTENPINLDGWQLVSQDGTPKINLSGTVPANGFYLLERTNDDTVPGISADKIYAGALSDSGENLKLYDNLNNLIDQVNCSTGWFAGLGKPEYKTMERKTDNNWQTSQNSSGTPKAKNSITQQVEQLSEKPQVAEETTYPSGIVINEILPSPEGLDEKEEWIEIFNQNSFEVDLSDWQITDSEGKTTAFIFPAGTKIKPNEFLVISRLITKITLNNDGDVLNLIQPNEKIIDSVTYEKAPRGQSYNRIASQWAWSNVLTPGSTNVISSISEKKEIETPKKEIKEQIPEKKIEEKERELATVEGLVSKERSSFLPLLISSSVAIFAGIIILVLKRKTKNFDLFKKLE